MTNRPCRSSDRAGRVVARTALDRSLTIRRVGNGRSGLPGGQIILCDLPVERRSRRPKSSSNSRSRKINFTKLFKSVTWLGRPRDNISLSLFQNLCFPDPTLPRSRGTYRDRHETLEAGCGGRGRIATLLAASTNDVNADGQVAWSRYPDAGIKSATMLAHRADDGGQKARRTRESAKQPLKPSRREGRVVLGWTCGTCRLHFFFAGGPRASVEARPSLPPLLSSGARREQESGADRVAITFLLARVRSVRVACGQIGA